MMPKERASACLIGLLPTRINELSILVNLSLAEQAEARRRTRSFDVGRKTADMHLNDQFSLNFSRNSLHINRLNVLQISCGELDRYSICSHEKLEGGKIYIQSDFFLLVCHIRI